ncbi:hypothetical protein BDV38DRAFT_236384 [Aspergillus pseudotamarii]|uniref:Uncharacterized protein n=1 Tax=Aspergillus pseudotamarii TaxID=132259 RepID=A0A5N6T7M1_ASPPS|nr:uncharacterized protein BDV38DRAFT_236384 [Aspergillus pseudotamarii]KAE8142345.1 hypothetical protein BDV38DRAFT_236384 [Aspergillus pseudotamarii]
MEWRSWSGNHILANGGRGWGFVWFCLFAVRPAELASFSILFFCSRSHALCKIHKDIYKPGALRKLGKHRLQDDSIYSIHIPSGLFPGYISRRLSLQLLH